MPSMLAHAPVADRWIGNRRRGQGACVFAAAVIVSVSLSAAVRGQGGSLTPAAKELSPGDVARLIAELDHDEYRVRQEATRRLSRGGVSAIAPLAKAAAGENLETAFRALAALKELGCALDSETEEAAFGAIESLAAGESRTAERAKSVLVGMKIASQHRAKERLRELGATVVDRGDPEEYDGPILVGAGVGGGAVFMARGGVIVGPGSTTAYYPGTIEISEKFTGKAEDLRLLRRIDEARQIVLAGEQITDDWLAQLKGASAASVQRIELRRTKVTDAGLAHLAGFSSAAWIVVKHTPISDASVDTLAKFSNAQFIHLYGTKISAAGAAKLATALPNAEIDRRGGALLGVSGSRGEQPCVVSTVQPDSAAAKAGIREYDVVVSFDGKPIGDFTELTGAISEKVGGETVEMEIVRATASESPESAAKPMKVKVTLGSW
ncbi:MAG: hypothetical protein DCC68_06810 [Planctomycetota bacterium]|nr:MAG: hypothetical protein DCC68_06810 [Planctomycetota bacterium]